MKAACSHPQTVTYSTGGNEHYTYDAFDRLIKVKTNTDVVVTDIEYRAGSAANTTTGMISKYTVSGNGWSHVYEYTYDSRGNIATIKKNGTEIVSYLYDEQNQLIYENNAIENATYYYAYLPNGNISVRLTYAYGTTYAQTDYAEVLAVDDYQYNNPSWADQLTVYNDSTITYDGIGNPLSYFGWIFDWQNRQLQSAVKGTDSLSYKYNSDGIRTAKILNGTTTAYVYESGKLRAQKTGNEIIWFQYGADGTPMSMTIGSNTYYYVKNWQKDIVGLTDASGNLVVEYTYDAWGKLLSTTGTLATTIGVKNPFRYRGYYYDTETGFYYLQSRYYDPAVRRFINADKLVATQTLNGMNLYAYCFNNPINFGDSEGDWPTKEDWINALEIIGDVIVQTTIFSSNPVETIVGVAVHYSRNSLNQDDVSEEELIEDGYKAVDENSDKFHQNNQKDGERNRKYVIGDWFSSEVVYYSDGTINNTPEDRGTFNVYSGDNDFLNIVVHGIFDVVPYIIWGNSIDDSTPIADRISVIWE